MIHFPSTKHEYPVLEYSWCPFGFQNCESSRQSALKKINGKGQFQKAIIVWPMRL